MSHDKFVVRHAATISEVLDLLQDFMDANEVAPQSLGMSRINDGYLAILGYDPAKNQEVEFIVCSYSLEDAKDLAQLEFVLNHAEDGLNEVVCHAVTVEDDELKIIVMSEV